MPQQNEVCERKNHTIPNVVRSLLVGSNIPKSFCLEAIKWTIHILIRNPTLVHNMMSEEAQNGQRLVVDHFRVFGCLTYTYTYTYIPYERKRKLDDKG